MSDKKFLLIMIALYAVKFMSLLNSRGVSQDGR